MRYIKFIVFIGLVFVALTPYAHAQQEEKATKLTEEQQRFDLDGNGELNPEENSLMLRITGIEAFSGSKFTREEIEKMRGGPPPGIGGGPPARSGGGRRGPRQAEKLVARFDTNEDGKLTGDERKAALETRGEAYNPEQRAGTVTGDIQDDIKSSIASTPKNSPALYEAGTLRTLYLRFPDEDWYAQLNAFYRTDVDVPAELVVDGKVYSEIGVRFRGTSSYFTVESAKKSFNIAVDYGDDSQRLYGYKTLNLLNGHRDASFLREVLYNQIARDYMPSMKTNLVKLVINGESWGVYINLQQYNKDFLDEWFGTRDGIRWKVGPGGGGLTYTGEDIDAYQQTYQLKTANVKNPYDKLIELCELLDSKTPDVKLQTELQSRFNVDRALWQLAVSNVFMDDDSYIHKGGDFAIYQDVNERIHLISHDNNETFMFGANRGGGGPGGRGPGGWSWGELTTGMVSPVTHADNAMRPVISRLLGIPEWKARYIAHVKTVVDEWLDWEVMEPIIKDYYSLIDSEVQQDNKKLYDYNGFQASIDSDRGGRTPSYKRFVSQRRENLLNHPELNKPTPKITAVSEPQAAMANQSIEISAEMDNIIAADSVILYYSTNRHAVFNHTVMSKSGNQFVGNIPAHPAGTKVYYYVEASAVDTHGTTTFYPARAEFGAAHYRVQPLKSKEVAVVINELMAANTNSIVDPQGDHEDWLELHNITDNPVLLTGMYLTDKVDNLKKWKFPKNTTIPPRGYLIVWLDEDGKAEKGLHANFKLSQNGETVILVDTDARGNQVIDTITFERQQKDTAIGRVPNATGTFQVVQMTPGTQNLKTKLK
ncbi:MAG: CotH kinase family protein [Candidatus Poribacteria bacterium]|nr:CotH kinase family protein [Candidatus Poribacteria bacterium]